MAHTLCPVALSVLVHRQSLRRSAPSIAWSLVALVTHSQCRSSCIVLPPYRVLSEVLGHHRCFWTLTCPIAGASHHGTTPLHNVTQVDSAPSRNASRDNGTPSLESSRDATSCSRPPPIIMGHPHSMMSPRGPVLRVGTSLSTARASTQAKRARVRRRQLRARRGAARILGKASRYRFPSRCTLRRSPGGGELCLRPVHPRSPRGFWGGGGHRGWPNKIPLQNHCCAPLMGAPQD